MGRWKRSAMPTMLLGCCLLLLCSGCFRPRVRHGLVLRGDWSLELNRVPWLKDRSTNLGTYSEPPDDLDWTYINQNGFEEGYPGEFSETPSAPAAGPTPKIGPPHHIPPPSQASPSLQTNPEPEADQTSVRGASHLQVCRMCGARGPAGRCRTCGHPEPPTQSGYAHSQYHPVPTQPVFSRRDDLSAAVPRTGTSIGAAVRPSETPRPNLRVVPSTQGPGMQSPEEIRTPRPEPPGGVRVNQVPRRLSSTTGPLNWIFRPPAARSLGPTNTAAATGGRWIRR